MRNVSDMIAENPVREAATQNPVKIKKSAEFRAEKLGFRAPVRG
jgi:hypothetical protein